MKISRYCDVAVIGLLVLVVFAVPLFFDVRLYSVFDLSKVMAMLFPCLFIMTIWLIKIIFEWNFRFPRTDLDLPILAFISIIIIATILSINPIVSLFGTYKRFEGLIETVAYIFLFFAFVTFVNNARKLNIVINAVVGTAVVTSGYGFLQYFGKDPFSWSLTNLERIFSTFGNPVFYSAFLITILPMSLALYLGYQTDAKGKNGATGKSGSNKRLLKDIGYGICALLIYTMFWHTKTRACFVGLMTLLPLFVIFIGKERRRAYWLKLSIMFGLFIIIGTFYSVRPSSSVFGYFAKEISFAEKGAGSENNGEKQEEAVKAQEAAGPVKKAPNDRFFLADKLSGSSFNRYYQFKNGLKVFNQYPLLGVGPDALGIVYQKHLSEVFTRRKTDGYWPRHDRIHNDILEHAVARGAIGLVTYIWLVLAYFWMVWKFIKSRKNIEGAPARAAGNQTQVAFVGDGLKLVDSRLLIVSFGSGIVGYIVQNEFSFGNTPIVALFWTILALTAVVVRYTQVQTFNYSQRRITDLHSKMRSIVNAPDFFLRKILLSTLAVCVLAFIIVHTVNWYRGDMFMEKGRKHVGGGDLDNGIRYYEEAIYLNPFEVNYRDMLTNAYFTMAGKTKDRVWLDKVVNLTHKNLQIIPQHYLSFFALGNVAYLLAQDHGEDVLGEAIGFYKKSLERDAFQPDVYNHLATCYIKTGKMDLAAEAMENSVINRPTSVGFADRLARIYLQQNKLDKAKTVYDEMLPGLSPTAPFLNAKGFYYVKRDNKEAAYIEFKKALEIDPKNKAALDNIVNLFLLEKKYEEAIPYLKRSIDLNPGDIAKRKNLAEIYATNKLYNEAISEYVLLIQVDPSKKVEYLDKIGKIFTVQNDLGKAILAYKEAIVTDPARPALYNNLGTLYAQMNMYKEAIETISKGSELRPEDTTFLENIAKIYLIQGDKQQAEAIANRILALDKDNKEANTILTSLKQEAAPN